MKKTNAPSISLPSVSILCLVCGIIGIIIGWCVLAPKAHPATIASAPIKPGQTAPSTSTTPASSDPTQATAIDFLKQVDVFLLTATSTKDGRILVSRSNLNRFFATGIIPTKDSWNASAHSEFVTYKNPKYGITSLSIPFNPKWGNARFAMTPYDEGAQSEGNLPVLVFGSVGYLQTTKTSSMWPSDFLFGVLPHKTVAEITAQPSFAQAKLKTKTINGHDVVAVQYPLAGGVLSDPVYIVIGSKYDYSFASDPNASADGVKQIQTIIEKLKVE
jgi:hypothetical protein